MKKIAVIGCGKIAQRHLNAYRKLGQNKIIVADKYLDVAKKTAKENNVKFACDPEKLIKNKESFILLGHLGHLI